MKQAVAFVLDASPTMETPLGSTGETLLDAAKRALQSMLLQVMTSKLNEVVVAVIHTHDAVDLPRGKGRMEEMVHFPNVSILAERQQAPTADLIRRVDEIEAYAEEESGPSKASLLDAIPIMTALFSP